MGKAKRMKIFHGPVNIGGIGGYLASYQREKGHDAQFIVWSENRFLRNHDQAVFKSGDERTIKSVFRRLKFACLWAFRFDVFNFYFGSTLLPFSLDLPLQRLMGKRVIMTYCGSDARRVVLERERNPFWSVIEGDLKGTLDDVKHDSRKKRMMRWQGFWCHKVLAPRNLYDHVVPFVHQKKIVSDVWVHNLSFSANVSSEEPQKECLFHRQKPSIPRLLHMPTSPQVKGTRFFRNAAKELKDEGLEFEYVEVMNTEHSLAIEELKKSDVILDQLLLGGFGSLSVEGMYYGKPVVCYMIDAVKNAHYPDCPIVNANLDTVKQCMKQLILDAALRENLGVQGQRFIADNFDYKAINEAMLRLYY